MATVQRKVPIGIKRELITKAGNKCANPGCANWNLHIHHIKHWQVYKAHESEHMIALCPACHDYAHRGALRISDEVLYQWRSREPGRNDPVPSIHVDPSVRVGILTGSVTLQTTNSVVDLFRLSDSNFAQLRILDEDLLRLNARLQDTMGEEIVRIVDNNVRYKRASEIYADYRPGRFRLTAPADDRYLPKWLLSQMLAKEGDFAMDGRISILDVEVLQPGIVRLIGCWVEDSRAVVITHDALYLTSMDAREALCISGEGLATTLLFAGSVDSEFFRLAKR